MKQYKLLALIALLGMISCSEDNEVQREQDVPISIVLKGEAAVVAYPGDKLTYNFELKSDNGLAEAFCRIGSMEVEGSKKLYEDAPLEAGYSFEYVPKDSQSGSTVDFVIEVTDVDGLKKVTDIPLYVRAKKPAISVSLPADAPSEFMIGTKLEFNVRITSESDFKQICLYKNENLVEGSLVDEFENPQELDYPFSYEPKASDAGDATVFKFEIMDVNGNIVTHDYSVRFIKPVSTELNEYTVTLGYQKNGEYGQYLASSSGLSYKMSEGAENCADIDIVVYFSANASTKGLGITSPTSTNAVTMYGNATTIQTAGGDPETDVITAWETKNTLKFKHLGGKIKDSEKSELTLDQFASVSTKKEISELWSNSESSEIVTALMVQNNAILVFKASDEEYGLLRVVERGADNKGSVRLEIKSFKNNQ